MLWLCLSLPCLPREALPEAPAGAPRRPHAERALLEAAAGCAYRYTDRISLVVRERRGGTPFHAVLMEIEGSLALFGSAGQLVAAVQADVAALGCAVRRGLAPTPAAAELFARLSHPVAVRRPEDLRAHLAAVPVTQLDLPAGVSATLRDVGLATLGELLALAPDALARRFGPETVTALRRLTGEAADPRPAWAPPPGFARRIELGAAVESFEALAFALQRLLLELQAVLVARDTAVLALTLRLEHEDRPASAIALRLAAPRRDAPALRELLRERLDRDGMAAPVVALALAVDAFAEPGAGQHDLFDDRQRHEASALALIERLSARLGPGAVQGCRLREDHRPERAFAECAPLAAGGAVPAGAPPRPLWLLAEPRLLTEPPPLLAQAPERIESGWWDGAGVARDYHVAQIETGARLWVFREHGQWYLHGYWA